MPDLSTTDEDITVVQWMAKIGQPIRQGQPILGQARVRAQPPRRRLDLGRRRANRRQPFELTLKRQIDHPEASSLAPFRSTRRPG